MTARILFLSIAFAVPLVPAMHGQASGRADRPLQGQTPANPGRSRTLTGVPRYRVGMRGPRGTTAEVQNRAIVITGKGDRTGTGGGGSSSQTLDVARFGNALGLPAGTPIHVKLLKAVNSGEARNGDMLDGVLAEPLGTMASGTPVRLTVVAAAKAGQITSAGELSVQVVSVNGEDVLSNVVTAQGEEGKKILPSDAPTRGTEAALSAGQALVLPVW